MEIAFSENRKGDHAMVRSKTRKLILAHKKQDALFFDLEKDPLEMTNVADDPDYREEIAAMTAAIHNWRSFDDLPKTYINEEAPIINRPNIPSRDDNHRKEMHDYCEEKMREHLQT